jgi:hypothetical protein
MSTRSIGCWWLDDDIRTGLGWLKALLKAAFKKGDHVPLLAWIGSLSHTVYIGQPFAMRSKHGHDILCSGAEVSRPYPACISATSNHTTRKKG